MGEIRNVYDQSDIAIDCFKKIIELGVKRISRNKNSRGIAFAAEIVNDSKFELYRLYYDSNLKLSKQYLSMYKKGLQTGVHTIFKPLSLFLLD